jgi:folate-binding protein YgfZ
LASARCKGKAIMLEPGKSLVWHQAPVFGLVGKDTRDLLQRLTTNDVLKAPVGAWLGNVFTSEKGRVLALVSLRLEDKGVTVVCNGPKEPLLEWLDRMTFREEVALDARTRSVLTLYREGMPDVLGIPGEHVVGTRDELQGKASEWRAAGAVDASAEAIEWWRVAHGVPAWGRDVDGERNPHEAHLGQLIDWKKGCYVGQEVVARLDTYKKVQRYLLKLALDRPVSGRATLWASGEQVGDVTSTAAANGAPYVAALGYVKASASEATALELRDEQGPVAARVIAW